jgi:hypothetical protein
MLPLNDPRWASYQGGYRTTYDASKVLRGLLEGEPSRAASGRCDEEWTAM